MSETATAAPVAQKAPSATYGFVKLIVSDLEGAVSFYERALGLSVAQTVDLPDIREKIMRKAGAETGPSIVLYQHKDGRALTAGDTWGPIGFYVRDVDVSFAHVVAQGGKPSRPPFDIGDMRIAFVHDPEGHEIELVSMKR